MGGASTKYVRVHPTYPVENLRPVAVGWIADSSRGKTLLEEDKILIGCESFTELGWQEGEDACCECGGCGTKDNIDGSTCDFEGVFDAFTMHRAAIQRKRNSDSYAHDVTLRDSSSVENSSWRKPHPPSGTASRASVTGSSRPLSIIHFKWIEPEIASAEWGSYEKNA
mmetsp:Transcript_85714/g.135363  ORF Transcript_85714/g.135363 Transcript_85714/m.135363 type:complete len:168 (-) Transcript_85714:270-773(-)|eukprot:CAMPEP_0169064342 /NCGR_PEP_ID=MMETSP1015-20121227/1780_1 /TAXON_ID=342587 /ORGANISM="Karlodinium micrum, Strain CCMP2283" /LENGTH=167 /DNA_ID=CAMNT_0009122765 /DNA_START=71 /DNA_END=574 /DNA_ORIENTATION=-